MKKLTAGIFAGILTIVTVNAADAAIATSGYVQEQVGAVDKKVGTLNTLTTTAKDNTVAAINEVVGKVSTNTTNIATNTSDISDLKSSVKDLTTGDNSVAGQIAAKLGQDFPADSTVKAELDKKADKTALEATDAKVATNKTAIDGLDTRVTTVEGNITSLTENKANKADVYTKNDIDGKVSTIDTAIGKKQDKSTEDYAMGTQAGGWKALTADELGALQSGIKAADVTQITTNKTDIAGIKTNIGTVPENKTVVGLIEEAKTAAGTDLTGKLGNLGEGNNTVADALAKKQNLLDDTNVKVAEDSTGNAVTAVTAENGTVTVTLGKSFIEQTKTTGAAGHYVLTADVSETGVTNYQWEKIDRATSESTGS